MIFLFPTCSDAVDSVTSLYNHVEEQAHVLVQRSNMSLEHLEYLLQLREVEGHFMQVCTPADVQMNATRFKNILGFGNCSNCLKALVPNLGVLTPH